MKVYESLAFAHALRCGKVLFRKEEVQILESAIRDDAVELARLREVERLAKRFRAKAMEFRIGERLGWPESEAAFAAGKLHAASEALFAALGEKE